MGDRTEEILTEILREHVQPFPPAHHIAAVLLRELPKHGLAIVGMGAIVAPRPTPPSGDQ